MVTFAILRVVRSSLIEQWNKSNAVPYVEH